MPSNHSITHVSTFDKTSFIKADKIIKFSIRQDRQINTTGIGTFQNTSHLHLLTRGSLDNVKKTHNTLKSPTRKENRTIAADLFCMQLA